MESLSPSCESERTSMMQASPRDFRSRRKVSHRRPVLAGTTSIPRTSRRPSALTAVAIRRCARLVALEREHVDPQIGVEAAVEGTGSECATTSSRAFASCQGACP